MSKPHLPIPYIRLYIRKNYHPGDPSQPRASRLQPFFVATFAGPLEKLSPGKSALFANHSLSERSEFELFANAFSRFFRA